MKAACTLHESPVAKMVEELGLPLASPTNLPSMWNVTFVSYKKKMSAQHMHTKYEVSQDVSVASQALPAFILQVSFDGIQLPNGESIAMNTLPQLN